MKEKKKERNYPKTVNIPVEPELSKRLSEFCEETRVSKTSIGRMLLTDFLRDRGYWK